MLKYLFQFNMKEYLICFRSHHLVLVASCSHFWQQLPEVPLGYLLPTTTVYFLMALNHTSTTMISDVCKMKLAHRATVNITTEATKAGLSAHDLSDAVLI